jgi:signal transduction histidine kinase/ActR/RegA family two-component response regulator
MAERGGLGYLFAILLLFLTFTQGYSLDPQISLSDYRYDTWTSENGFPGTTVQSIVQTQDGYLWFGTVEGLVKFDGVHFTVFDKAELSTSTANILFLREDSRGALWIGTRGGGVVRYQNGKFQTFTTQNGLANDMVWYIQELRNGDLWFSTEKGINIYHEGKFSLLATEFRNEFVWSIFQDSHRNIWLGSDENGLLEIKNEKEIAYKHSDGLAGDGVFCIAEDKDGALWVGTRTGLSRYKDGKFTNFTTRNGLSSNQIYSLLIDRDGVLWIGTYDGGINRYRNGKFEVFSRANGLSSGSVWSLYEDREGSIWIGPTSYGVHRFADDRKSNRGIAPPVAIEQVIIGGKEAAPGRTTVLHDVAIEINYSALSFVAPEKVKFRYRLDGYDKDWVDAGDRRTAYYKRVPPGSYRFQVLAANHNGVWNRVGTAAEIQLVLPLTRRSWFYALCILLSFCLAVSIYYLRVRTLRNQERTLRMIVDDRTAKLEKEVQDRKRAEEQLQQIQKMEAIGRLAGGVAHDFNNILMAVSGYSELVLLRMSESDPLRQYICEIRKAAEQGGDLTRQLLAFSRRQLLTPKVLDLNDSILAMENLLRRLIGEDIELEIVKAKDLGTIKADPGQVQQILMNLAVNARDAMPAGGTLKIETSNRNVNLEMSKQFAGLKPGHYVMLRVKDTGHGMDEDVIKHIFEPFFTTKDEGKGTGLGLATVFGIVQQSDGHIYVESRVNEGTTFSLYLPRVDRPVSPQLEAPVSQHPNGKGETLLLVDDNEMVRSSAGSFLEMNGYHVLYAGSGLTALDLLKANGRQIHLMISDVVMPGMSGVELAEEVKQFRPDLKVLFISGYANEQNQLQDILDSGCEFIAKPVAMELLLHKIHALLNKADLINV